MRKTKRSMGMEDMQRSQSLLYAFLPRAWVSKYLQYRVAGGVWGVDKRGDGCGSSDQPDGSWEPRVAGAVELLSGRRVQHARSRGWKMQYASSPSVEITM